MRILVLPPLGNAGSGLGVPRITMYGQPKYYSKQHAVGQALAETDLQLTEKTKDNCRTRSQQSVVRLSFPLLIVRVCKGL